ncbi:hypothetical protein PMAYCL1PPCAC_09359 [Pristionchus mayeri]|uniref:Uncharacterized protein n=1 Tax=Pristionchus mayeri TaxID=1317129 RepID=A0AAN4ZGS6_9BILA|nr:hypothetical protein PMAYCL1PPCAC_09359 [Pristionchus mayeri]
MTSTENIQLRETRIEPISDHTSIHQTNHGTIFYYVRRYPSTLYVKWKGKVIHANLPADYTSNDSAHGDAFYFATHWKIYAARFAESDGITISCLRDRIDGEKFHGHGLCSRRTDRRVYVYRLWDDPYEEAVLIDVCSKQFKNLALRGVPREKAIFFKNIKPEMPHPTVAKLSDHIIVVTVPNHLTICNQDSSPSCTFRAMAITFMFLIRTWLYF